MYKMGISDVLFFYELILKLSLRILALTYVASMMVKNLLSQYR